MPTLADFAGEWRLERRIDDRLEGRHGHLAGRVRLGSDGAGGLVYDEEGELSLGGGPAFRTTRRYLWRADGPRIAVRFSDGRFFHAFDPALPAPAARHDCDPDLYRVRYDFGHWPRWRAEWRVRGPRKDYVSVSEHVPVRSTLRSRTAPCETKETQSEGER